MIINPRLAGKIDGSLLSGDITGKEADLLHKWRRLGIPKCLGHYNPQCSDCLKQDILPCKLCKKLG